MDLMKLLQQLTAAYGVSGCEGNIAQTAKVLLAPYCDTVEVSHGNVIGTIGVRTPAKPHVLLDAHMDQVGFYVTAITDEGFIRVGNVGGLDRRLLPDQRVILHGCTEIPGVVCCVPPHLQNGKEQVVSIEELAIDTGLSKETLEARIQPGDSVSFDMPLQTLLNDTVTGASLDDRCGMAAILYALEQVKGKELPCTISVLFSTQEEVGERGAMIGAFAIDPDIAIAVDVTFALGHGDDPKKCGKLGKGPMIGISPSLSRTLSKTLIYTARQNAIAWQPEVMPGMTGTNADRFSVTRCGVAAATVSIPLRYMHTPSELIAIADVEATGRLLAAYLENAVFDGDTPMAQDIPPFAEKEVHASC